MLRRWCWSSGVVLDIGTFDCTDVVLVEVAGEVAGFLVVVPVAVVAVRDSWRRYLLVLAQAQCFFWPPAFFGEVQILAKAPCSCRPGLRKRAGWLAGLLPCSAPYLMPYPCCFLDCSLPKRTQGASDPKVLGCSRGMHLGTSNLTSASAQDNPNSVSKRRFSVFSFPLAPSSWMHGQLP